MDNLSHVSHRLTTSDEVSFVDCPQRFLLLKQHRIRIEEH